MRAIFRLSILRQSEATQSCPRSAGCNNAYLGTMFCMDLGFFKGPSTYQQSSKETGQRQQASNRPEH
jgi:hypothetical protein